MGGRGSSSGRNGSGGGGGRAAGSVFRPTDSSPFHMLGNEDGYFSLQNFDPQTQAAIAAYLDPRATPRQNGWMSANDIRELENLDRIPAGEGGDLYLINGNMLPLKNAGAFASEQQEEF